MTEPTTPPASEIRPSVGGAVSSRSVWVFAVLLIAGAVALFAALESRRTVVTQPALGPALAGNIGDRSGLGGTPPPLALPQYEPPQILPQPMPSPMLRPEPVAPVVRPARRLPPQPSYMPPPAPVVSEPPPKVDYGRQPYNVGAPPAANPNTERVTATRFVNPSTTVPKGTVIMAVLESAIDSARPGMVRAMVSRDVRGFDGTRILIPRGSRLIGEYKSDVGAGQKRALVQWTRLLRPDGAVINLDSPVADPQGRAGVLGKLDTHFWARFSGALLQSIVNIGNQVAINSLSRSTNIYGVPVIGAYPGAGAGGGNLVPQISPNTPPPTLTVKPGASVSVFTAKDLDFSTVEQ